MLCELGLSLDSVVTVVGGFEVGRLNLAAELVQPPVDASL